MTPCCYFYPAEVDCSSQDVSVDHLQNYYRIMFIIGLVLILAHVWAWLSHVTQRYRQASISSSSSTVTSTVSQCEREPLDAYGLPPVKPLARFRHWVPVARRMLKPPRWWWRRARAPVPPRACRSASSCSCSGSRRLVLSWTRSASARRAARGEARHTAARWTSRSRARGAWTGARWAAWPRAIQVQDSASTTSAGTRTPESGPGASSATRVDASTGATATANKVHQHLRATASHQNSVYTGRARALSCIVEHERSVAPCKQIILHLCIDCSRLQQNRLMH